MDGADAGKWAWILVGIGAQEDVEKYIDWIMQDVTAFQEAVLLPAITAKPLGGKGGRPNAQHDQDDHAHQRPPNKANKGKYKSNGKGKGKQNTWKKRQWDDHANDKWRKKSSWQSQWNWCYSQWDRCYENDNKTGNVR